MAKNNNKGFSLVEIVVAVAVFAILIIPLSRQLISSININKTSTKKQYSIEKAEEIMETLKVADIDLSTGANIYIPDGQTDTVYEFTLAKTTVYYQDLDGDGASETAYHVYKYTCSDIMINESYQKYESTIFVNDLAYVALANGYVWTTLETSSETGEVTSGSGEPSETTGVGTIRNLDNSQVAIIASASYMGAESGTTLNILDNYAYEYFLEEEVKLLQDIGGDWYSQYQAGNINLFANDKISKATYITITKSGGEYTVQCKVTYTLISSSVISDALEEAGKDTYTQVVYSNTYDQLVPVYLLYIPLMYDDYYITDTSDEIYVDTSGLSEDEEAKIYIFETAANVSSLSGTTYESVIVDVLGLDSTSANPLESLVYSNSAQNATNLDVALNVYLNANKYTSSTPTTTIYTNLYVGTGSNVTACKTTDTSYDDLDEIFNISDDVSGETYLYDLMVIIGQTDGTNVTNTTTVTGTRGQ